MTIVSSSVAALTNDLDWLQQRITRLAGGAGDECTPLQSLPAKSALAKLLHEHQLSEADRITLLLAFATIFRPVVFTPFALRMGDPASRALFGGLTGEEDGQFHPTLRTAIYILSAGDEEMTDYYLRHFNSRHPLFTSGLLQAHAYESCRNFVNRQLVFNDQFTGTLLCGEAPALDSEPGFPAKRGKRSHTMKDVVLEEKTVAELEKLRRFARNMKKLWELPGSERYRRNFIGIFSGDPGTGKSHTAEAIGNELGLPVYKVNFAQLVSKYIGETEKNLEKIFDRFSGKPGILFFDEAESIFSKRTEVKDSHDKHSNNEQSYLLQKIEEYNGIVILATNVQNLSQYFDKAFQRRIRQIINFAFPEFPERLKLWEKALAPPFGYEERLAENLARNYQLSGGGIYNVVSEGVTEALDRGVNVITFEMLEPAMIDEFRKTGRRCEICPDEKVMQDPVKRFGPGYEQRKNF